MLEDLLRQLMGADPYAVRIGAPRDQGEPDEVRLVRIKYRNDAGQEVVTPATRVEIRRKATFGFAPRRERLEARLELPAEPHVLPVADISLLEDDQPVGKEGAWRCRWAELSESGAVVCYWLEES